MSESFATGSDIAGAGLTTAWNAIQALSTDQGPLKFDDRERFDVLRGWPLGGAITFQKEMEAQLDPGDADILVIRKGQFVEYGTAGLFQLATSTANVSTTAPKKIMCVLDDSTSTTVVASKKLPVLTTNYVVRTGELFGAETAADFDLGAPVAVNDGYLTSVVGANTQIIGTVRGIDVTTSAKAPAGTVDIEVV